MSNLEALSFAHPGSALYGMGPPYMYDPQHAKDLKLLDDLLVNLKWTLGEHTWERVEAHSSIARGVMNRLREAWENEEMKEITRSLANYFKNKPK